MGLLDDLKLDVQKIRAKEVSCERPYCPMKIQKPYDMVLFVAEEEAMTEYELTDAINSTMSVYASTFTLYLTIISAYLIAGFVVGQKLSKQQFVIVSILFFFASGLVVLAMSGLGSRLAHTADALRLVNADHPIKFNTMYINVLNVILILGMIASFKFMWDIRHPKSE